MSTPKEKMAEKLMEASKSPEHSSTISDAILNYLIENTVVSGSSSGGSSETLSLIKSSTSSGGSLDTSGFSGWASSIENFIINNLVLNNSGSESILFGPGLNLTQDMIGSAHKSCLYYWESVSNLSEEEKNTAIEIQSTNDFPASISVGSYGKISSEYYICKFNENAPNPHRIIWEKISEQIILWIEDISCHNTSFTTESSGEGESETLTITSIIVN